MERKEFKKKKKKLKKQNITIYIGTNLLTYMTIG